MKPRFSPNMKLPDYLERALAPLSWSGVFSQDFRLNIINIIMAVEPAKAVNDFAMALTSLAFLDDAFKRNLLDALRKFAREREQKNDNS